MSATLRFRRKETKRGVLCRVNRQRNQTGEPDSFWAIDGKGLVHLRLVVKAKLRFAPHPSGGLDNAPVYKIALPKIAQKPSSAKEEEKLVYQKNVMSNLL
jgi:hypothetical protein